MKKPTPAAVAAPIFNDYPNVTCVYVVGKYGFTSLSSAKFYAGKKKIVTVKRPDAAEEEQNPPKLTNNFKGLNKAQLLAQGELRGMTLSIEDSNKTLIEQLEAYDANLKRDDEPEAPNENGGPQPAEDIDVKEPENVE